MKKTAKAANKKPAPIGFFIAFTLAAVVLLIYSQAATFDFVTYDDPDYTTANPHIQGGFTLPNIVWAFTSSYAGNWFPLTWLSHMLDWQLFGSDAGMHHMVNVFIHTATTVLLFFVSKQMTGAQWRSALVAFFFGLHPLHVESVAWIAERKDVLSALFWVLTLWSYARYARQPALLRYGLTLLFFVCGLVSKPMVVTLPLVLILLDYWPLRRGNKLLEKLPFFALSIGGCIVAYIAHTQALVEQIPLAIRVENALISYVIYAWKTFWPIDLGMFYPYPLQSLLVPAVICTLALIATTIAALRVHSRFPYLATGWLWYLIVLLPVIGIIQVGAQARADRYTYLPSIGFFIAIVWGTAEALQRWPQVRVALAAAACAGCAALTAIQIGYWRDNVTLYQHAIAVAPDAYVARANLATVLETRGEREEAIAQLKAAVATRPTFAVGHAELGQLLAQNNEPQQGLQELREAVSLKPDMYEAHFRLGSVLGSTGDSAGAAVEFQKAIALDPNNPDAHFNLAIALGELGRFKEAIAQASEAIRLNPNFPEAQQLLSQLKTAAHER